MRFVADGTNLIHSHFSFCHRPVSSSPFNNLPSWRFLRRRYTAQCPGRPIQIAIVTIFAQSATDNQEVVEQLNGSEPRGFLSAQPLSSQQAGHVPHLRKVFVFPYGDGDAREAVLRSASPAYIRESRLAGLNQRQSLAFRKSTLGMACYLLTVILLATRALSLSE